MGWNDNDNDGKNMKEYINYNKNKINTDELHRKIKEGFGEAISFVLTKSRNWWLVSWLVA